MTLDDVVWLMIFWIGCSRMQLTFENIGEHVVLLAGGAFISRLMTNLVMMIIAGGAFISRSIMWCITRLWMSYRIHNTNLNWLFVWVRYYSRVISETVASSVAHCFSIPMLNLHSNITTTFSICRHDKLLRVCDYPDVTILFHV